MPITKSHLESCFAFVGVYDNFFKTVSKIKKKKKQVFKTRYRWWISHCSMLHTLLHPQQICFNNKRKILREEKHSERLFSYSFKWPLLHWLLHLEVGMFTPNSLWTCRRQSECCCFQGPTRPFFLEDWHYREHGGDSAALAPGVSPASETFWPTARPPCACGDDGSQDRGERIHGRLLEAARRHTSRTPPGPLPSCCPHCNRSKLGRSSKLPLSLSLPAPNRSWALEKVWLPFSSSKGAFGRKKKKLGELCLEREQNPHFTRLEPGKEKQGEKACHQLLPPADPLTAGIAGFTF